MPKDLPVFKNKFGAPIRHPLLRQIEQDIKKNQGHIVGVRRSRNPVGNNIL